MDYSRLLSLRHYYPIHKMLNGFVNVFIGKKNSNPQQTDED